MSFKFGLNNGIPNICGEVPVGKDGGESVIKDQMILGRDLAGLKIENQSNIGTMLLAVTQENTTVTLTSPFGQLFTILKCWIQDIDQTAKKHEDVGDPQDCSEVTP